MEKVFLIGAAGYVALSLYNFKLKKNYKELNTNKFLVNVIIWGFFPYLSSLVVKELAKTCTCLMNYLPSNPAYFFILEVLTTLMLAFLSGYLLSCKCAQKVKNWFLDFITSDNVPLETNGLIEYDWERFVNPYSETLIFTLKNNKVYVGMLLYADIQKDMPEDQRAIRIIPLKSGIRNSDGIVNYHTFYVITKSLNLSDKQVSKLSDAKLKELSDKFENELKNELKKIEPLVIFQREIVSYTIYSEELDAKFYGI